MLRVELDPNGPFNVTEFGTVKDPDQFKALYAYSPYHHVKDGTAYPAILFPTGENDHRVNPMQSRKMTARLQAATQAQDVPSCCEPAPAQDTALARRSTKRIEEEADVLSFLFDQLGISYRTYKVGVSAPLMQQWRQGVLIANLCAYLRSGTAMSSFAQPMRKCFHKTSPNPSITENRLFGTQTANIRQVREYSGDQSR